MGGRLFEKEDSLAGVGESWRTDTCGDSRSAGNSFCVMLAQFCVMLAHRGLRHPGADQVESTQHPKITATLYIQMFRDVRYASLRGYIGCNGYFNLS